MKYNVTVNGKKYEVEVERAAAAGSAKPEEQKQAVKEPATAGSELVRSPMPGTIVGVKVSVGQSVKKGQVLLILEAMKMENEIVAAHDGVIESIAVAKGNTVNTNDILLSLK